jgi:hypothetical protein
MRPFRRVVTFLLIYRIRGFRHAREASVHC